MKALKTSQKGATLIIVLIILLLVSSMSAMAIKTIIMSNKLNSSQIASTQLIKEANLPIVMLTDTQLIKQRKDAADKDDAIFKYALDKKDHELVSCYLGTVGDDYFKPRSTKISTVYLDEKGVVNNSSTTKEGFCDASKSFSSSRKTTVTQVSIKYLGEGKNNDDLYAINSISIMPKSLNSSSGSVEKINACFSNHLNMGNTEGDNTVEACLSALNVANKNLYAVLPIKKD